MRDSRTVIRFASAALVACLAPLLASCGGGGGGNDLTVGFGYANFSSPLFMPVQSAPLLSGLGGNTPNCSVTSGSLPPGESLGAGCAIVGTPTALGDHSATITLTVDGYRGSVSATISIGVQAPALTAISGPFVGPNQTLALGAAVNNVAIVSLATFGGPYVPQAGDTRVYSVSSGVMPTGLTLDPTTGTVSGSPTAFGVATLSVQLTLGHGLASYTTNSVPVQFSIVEGAFTLAYPPCCGAANVGDAVAIAPTSGYIPVPGATVSFQFGGQAPPGLAIDPATGAITGLLAAAGTYNPVVTQTARLPDGTSVTGASPPLSWSITGPSFTYAAFTLYAFTGMPFAHFPSPITGGLLGDLNTFSMVPTPTPPSTPPLPAWLFIDAATGELFGTSPAPTGIGTFIDIQVILTTRRNGHDYTIAQRVTLSQQ